MYLAPGLRLPLCMSHQLAVFFDLGDTLASPVVENGNLARLEVYPFVPEVLQRLRGSAGEAEAVRIGLISNTGNAPAGLLDDLLTTAGLRALVDPPLCLFSSVEGLDKSQPALFQRAAARAGLPSTHCWYVGEDAAERDVASSVGFRVSPQPLHALHHIGREISPPIPLSTTRPA